MIIMAYTSMKTFLSFDMIAIQADVCVHNFLEGLQ